MTVNRPEERTFVDGDRGETPDASTFPTVDAPTDLLGVAIAEPAR
jgi:hypothetical protein